MRKRFELTGWIIFLGCSGLFITQAVLSRDAWGLATGITFLVGCLVFLTPYLASRE
jgi:hypothetical protein